MDQTWPVPVENEACCIKEGCGVDKLRRECNWGDIRRADSARKVGEQDETVMSVMSNPHPGPIKWIKWSENNGTQKELRKYILYQ